MRNISTPAVSVDELSKIYKESHDFSIILRLI